MIATLERRGFALLSVLLVIAGASTICLAIALDGADAANAGRNRINAERAHWAVRACLSRLLHSVDLELARESDAQERARIWRSLASRVQTSQLSDHQCVTTLEAKGVHLDINDASEPRLLALFAAAGLGASRTDLTHSLLDWVDADDEPRAQGGEVAEYLASGRLAPRNGPMQDVSELPHVRGFEQVALTLAPFISTRSARISLDHAPAEVLSTLPGFTPEVVSRVIERRATDPIDDLRELFDLVSASAAEGLLESYPELVQLAVAGTEGWLVAVTASVGAPLVSSTIHAELVPLGGGANVVRWTIR